ncbi:MAG: hypothetical protein JO113_06880 [Candidatus Eremiobacteraeota bacterium]|nr:hypothetical protein [Candidatus Eremiobacteraeota bacterium]
MSKQQFSRQIIMAAAIGLAAASCTHKTSADAQINQGFAPFSSTRNQAVALVYNTKRSLDAADVNNLAVAYTALQEKANAYAGFMVEAVTTSSFDSTRNSKYATDFANAIAAFDKSYATLTATRRQPIAETWVPSFAESLQTRWDQYDGYIAKMTPQQKADLIKDLKHATVWPNYEDIATEAVPTNVQTAASP